MTKRPGIDISTASLGQGLACAAGMALAGKMDKKSYKVFCVVGDDEAQEGEIWEAANTAHKYKLDNLITFVDVNNLQLDGATEEVMPNGDLGDKFRAFCREALELDGHDTEQIVTSIESGVSLKIRLWNWKTLLQIPNNLWRNSAFLNENNRNTT